jgi:hypothetical protein
LASRSAVSFGEDMRVILKKEEGKERENDDRKIF